MRFIETPVFTRELRWLLPDDEYRALQVALLLRPEQGSVIPGGAGLRKLRWGIKEKGKRGGLRIIYYWDRPQSTIYMLLLYPKSQQEDLTRDQLRVLSRQVQEGFR